MLPRVLIIGGDSIIGRALASRFNNSGWEVMVTTRRSAGEGFYLDLSQDPAKWPMLPAVEVAIISGGVTSLVNCARQPVASSRVNVEGTTEVAKLLVASGAQVIFLSSSQVFSGKNPMCLRQNAYEPVSEYGRQKVKAEKQILQLGSKAAVLRITKVIESNWSLISDWKKRLLEGRIIHPFNNLCLAPVSITHVISLIEYITREYREGIYQLSGNLDISYLELAKVLAKALNVSDLLIKAEAGSAEKSGFDRLPFYSSLDMSIEHQYFGMSPPNSRKVIKETISTSISRAI